jgi:hypothetical protein
LRFGGANLEITQLFVGVQRPRRLCRDGLTVSGGRALGLRMTQVFTRQELVEVVRSAGPVAEQSKGYVCREKLEPSDDGLDLKLGKGDVVEATCRVLELRADSYDLLPTWFFHGTIDADAEMHSDRVELARWLKHELRAHYVHVQSIDGSSAEIMAHFL